MCLHAFAIAAAIPVEEPRCELSCSEGGRRLAAALTGQLTGELEKARIEIATSAAANTATTAKLSHASAVTLPAPQMSCNPFLEASIKP